jgi:hypothetical protein
VLSSVCTGQPVASVLRREDVFISLVGAGREDWSFGNGESSLIKS